MFKIGDKVKMVDCYEAKKNPNKAWEVVSDPWEMCGSVMVMLEGKSGGFDASCLEKI